MSPDTVDLLVDVLNIVLALGLLALLVCVIVVAWRAWDVRYKSFEEYLRAREAMERGTSIRKNPVVMPKPRRGKKTGL